VLLLDTDRFVRVNGFTDMLFHNAVTKMDFMNVRKIAEKLQNEYFIGVYVLLLNLYERAPGRIQSTRASLILYVNLNTIVLKVT
jgi:hypothetical protein